MVQCHPCLIHPVYLRQDNMNKPLKPLMLIGPNVSPETADAMRKDGRFEIITASIGKFPSGGLFVELFRDGAKLEPEKFPEHSALLKGAPVYVLQSTSEANNDHLQHLMLMGHTLKWYGAQRVTAIVPFLANLRQDRSLKDRFTSVAADLNARQMQASGIDGVITLTPHSKSAISLYQKVFGESFVAIPTTKMFSRNIESSFDVSPEELVIGAPDGADKPGDEGQYRARELAKEIFGSADPSNMFHIVKAHTGVSETTILSFNGQVAGKDTVIVDDMIDGGTTTLNAANILKAHGARSVTADATHALLTGNALENLMSAKPDGMSYAIDKLVVSDSLPEVHEKITALLAKHPKYASRIQVLSSGPAILEKITELQAKAAIPFLQSYKPPNPAPPGV